MIPSEVSQCAALALTRQAPNCNFITKFKMFSILYGLWNLKRKYNL